MDAEQQRLDEYATRAVDWKKWGPYLAERAWGTVREDYSANGDAWHYFPHDMARSRAYRWNEDGIFGLCDRQQILCFALALWNGKDTILKERFFGLSGPEGNHGEDVKELYYYLDATPSHSYGKALYKYPHAAFPYERLVWENARRTRDEWEFEIMDTGVFDEDRYFDVFAEYAKASPEEVLIRISAVNRGPEEAALHLLPTLWFRNTWSWAPGTAKPAMKRIDDVAGQIVLEAGAEDLGKRWLISSGEGTPETLFTENESNAVRLFPGGKNASAFVKDSINDYVVQGWDDGINRQNLGTKAAVHYRLTLKPGETKTIVLRLTDQLPAGAVLGAEFDKIFAQRIAEADAFYARQARKETTTDARNIQRQAYAGLLWNKQFYHYDVRTWLRGDETQPTPPAARWCGRNNDWQHLSNDAVMSMPDKWEFPWYAAWDLAFHCVAMAPIDAEFAKRQLILLLREWYMHPNGQLPAYEWCFDDVNPPVQAWAALRVYRIERRVKGKGDRAFLERVFQKLLINFTWWINRKDRNGRNLFQGGFLGLDNIGLFDRSQPLPSGCYLDQCDGTSWMATYCLNMLAIALELAAQDATHEDVATKFLEHFFYIAHAMNDRPSTCGNDGVDLWDGEDGFYYDMLHLANGTVVPLRMHSAVGLMPLLAVETLDAKLLQRLPSFARRLEWFLEHRPELCKDVASVTQAGAGQRRLFSVVNEERLRRVLSRMLDEKEFLSPYGLRSLSKYHQDHPVTQILDGTVYDGHYEPGESRSATFGGNSNWRGPVWFPLNYLIIEALQKFDFYYGKNFQIECPTGSGKQMPLWEVAAELSRRLIAIFERDANGRRAVNGGVEKFQSDANFKDYLFFHEYFHGDNGAGLGASHQTGWTALVAKLIQQQGTCSRA